MRALFVLFGWQTAERKAVTAPKLDRVLRHVGIYDTKIGRMPMHCHQTPRSANSILACTLKQCQPRLEAPFSTWIHNCCSNIAKIPQMTPSFREGQLIYELWP